MRMDACFDELIFTYERPDGEEVDVIILYNEDIKDFFVKIDIPEQEAVREVLGRNLHYTMYKGNVYAPLAFFRKLSVESGLDGGKCLEYLEVIEQEGRKVLMGESGHGYVH